MFVLFSSFTVLAVEAGAEDLESEAAAAVESAADGDDEREAAAAIAHALSGSADPRFQVGCCCLLLCLVVVLLHLSG